MRHSSLGDLGVADAAAPGAAGPSARSGRARAGSVLRTATARALVVAMVTVTAASVATWLPRAAETGSREAAESAGKATGAGEAAPPPADAARTARLQGSAYLDRRTGVVGAAVIVQSETDPSRVFLTTTDRKGRFRLEGLPEGSYRVEVRRDGLVPVVKREVSLKYPFRAVVEVPMRPGDAGAADPGVAAVSAQTAAVVRARVSDEDGRPVKEGELRLVRADGAADPRVARSGPLGELELRELPPGKWELSLRALGYLPIRASLDLAGPTDLRLVVVPQPNDYEPSPLDLLPPERPTPPPGFEPGPVRPPEDWIAAGLGPVDVDPEQGDDPAEAPNGAEAEDASELHEDDPQPVPQPDETEPDEPEEAKDPEGSATETEPSRSRGRERP